MGKLIVQAVRAGGPDTASNSRSDFVDCERTKHIRRTTTREQMENSKDIHSTCCPLAVHRLKDLLAQARSSNVPRDIIDRNIKRASEKGQADFSEVCSMGCAAAVH